MLPSEPVGAPLPTRTGEAPPVGKAKNGMSASQLFAKPPQADPAAFCFTFAHAGRRQQLGDQQDQAREHGDGEAYEQGFHVRMGGRSGLPIR